jgi:DNA repair exonuclease SbcCD ATPase subunit
MKEIDDFTQLILNELKSNREAVDSLRRDIDHKLDGIKKDIAEVRTTEKEIAKLTKWQAEITETWSPRQMKEAKDEIYSQKNKWEKAVGIITVLQIIIAAILSWLIKNV